MKEKIKIIVVAISSVLSVKLAAYLTSLNIQGIYVVSITAVLGVAFVNLMEFLLVEFPMKYATSRKYIDPIANFEGIWINRIDNLVERPFSVACFEYNKNAKQYRYYGRGIDENGNILSTWESTDLMINIKKDEIMYYGEGQIFDKAAESIKSFAQIRFTKNVEGQYDFGTGFFVDFGTNFFKTTFKLKRLPMKGSLFKKNYGLLSDEEILNILKEKGIIKSKE